jgi:hypothetical protein
MTVRFQVDPDFYDHPKSIGMSDAAVALWTRAGSYSAAKLTDGFIAEHVLATLSRTPEEAADELTRRGLWRRVRGGYQYHQWDHRNLTKARVEEDRAADRDRKKRARKAPVDNRGPGVDGPAGGQGSRASPQANGHNVRSESGRNPNGIQQESGGIPGASVSVSVSESVSVSGRPRGRAVPRCRYHRGQPAHNCALCRSEQLADQETT